jgi:hypothetical protein
MPSYSALNDCWINIEGLDGCPSGFFICKPIGNSNHSGLILVCLKSQLNPTISNCWSPSLFTA